MKVEEALGLKEPKRLHTACPERQTSAVVAGTHISELP